MRLKVRGSIPVNPEHYLTTNPPGKEARITPCTLRLLTPALLTRSLPLARPSRACGFAHIPFAASQTAQVSFGEERENAGATFAVQGHNARMTRRNLTPFGNLTFGFSRTCKCRQSCEEALDLEPHGDNLLHEAIGSASFFRPGFAFFRNPGAQPGTRAIFQERGVHAASMFQRK